MSEGEATKTTAEVETIAPATWTSTTTGSSETNPISFTPYLLTAAIVFIITALLATVIFVLVQIFICKCHPKLKPGRVETGNLESAESVEGKEGEGEGEEGEGKGQARHEYEDKEEEGGLPKHDYEELEEMNGAAVGARSENSIALKKNQAYRTLVRASSESDIIVTRNEAYRALTGARSENAIDLKKNEAYRALLPGERGENAIEENKNKAYRLQEILAASGH